MCQGSLTSDDEGFKGTDNGRNHHSLQEYLCE